MLLYRIHLCLYDVWWYASHHNHDVAQHRQNRCQVQGTLGLLYIMVVVELAVKSGLKLYGLCAFLACATEVYRGAPPGLTYQEAEGQ